MYKKNQLSCENINCKKLWHIVIFGDIKIRHTLLFIMCYQKVILELSTLTVSHNSL